MKQTYSLRDKILPTIITPHDCYIVKIELQDDWLTFTFDDDIMHGEDSDIGPECKFDCIRFHLLPAYYSPLIIYRGTMRRNDRMKYRQITCNRLQKALKKGTFEYLYHYVAFNCIIIDLHYSIEKKNLWESYRIELDADTVEIEWSKKQ